MSCDLGVTNESTRCWVKNSSKTITLIIDIYSMTAVRSGNDNNYNLFLTAVSAASLLSCQREWSSKYAADTSWGGMKWPAWQTQKKAVHFLWNSTHLKCLLNEKEVWFCPIDEHSTRRKWPGVQSRKFLLVRSLLIGHKKQWHDILSTVLVLFGSG